MPSDPHLLTLVPVQDKLQGNS